MALDPMTLALLTAGLKAGGSIFGGALARNPKESQAQKMRRELLDEILASIRGEGEFSDLFNLDEDAFQKSFVDPAKARFRNQISPQIQQSFIASGQHRGTGLDDTLTRAGVDMDQLLNEQYMNFLQQGQNRKANALNSILGMSEGVQPGLSTGEKLRESAAGFLTGEGFGESMDQILDAYNKRKGFAT